MQITKDDEKTARSNALRRHTVSLNRRLIPLRRTTQHLTLAGRVGYWLFAWRLDDYPGIEAGMVEALGRRVGWETFKAWRSGRNRLPKWAAEMLADRIEARCRAGLSIVSELRAVEDPPRRAAGFFVLGPDGQSRRNRVGRKKDAPGAAPDAQKT